MKKICLIAALCLALCLALVACGSSTTTAQSQSSAAAAEQSSSAVEESTLESTPAETSASAADAAAEKTITGKVGDATAMHTLSLVDDKGTEYTFAIEDSSKMDLGSDGLVVGKAITVTYTGDLNGDHTLVSVTAAK